MRIPLLFLSLAFAATAHAQWTIQSAPTTASLRGIHSLGNGVAWASGTDGTVLRTEDNGAHWQHCAIPPDAEHLDFRGVQAFDKDTAIVMSSGTGDLSRLYKTTDGCQTWKLLFTNPDKNGFWDALSFVTPDHGSLLGDPVNGSFWLSLTDDGGKHWRQQKNTGLAAQASGQGAFAASNSSILGSFRGPFAFGSGGVSGAFVYIERADIPCLASCTQEQNDPDGQQGKWARTSAPLGHSTEASGIFSLGMRTQKDWVVVGGDYLKPDDSTNTAAFTLDGGKHWTTSTTPPHGYRSAVAYDAQSKTWITVGPNGTDISTDDGRNWHQLFDDNPSAAKNWNAISLPFVVGPHGRIGILREDILAPKQKP